MKYFFLLLLTLFLCLDLSAQALDALPTIDQPQEFDKIHTYTRGFSAAFRLDTLRKYFSADIVEGLAVDPYTAIPDSLRGRYFTSTSDSLYYVDYFGAFVNLTPGTGGGGGTTWNDLTGIPDSIVYSSELAEAQAAAEAYADANDANTQNPFQTISKAGSTVTLSDGGGSFTDEVTDGDSSPTNELQTISKVGTIVTLSNGGGSFTVIDPDADATNELQTISKTGSTVTLSDGGGLFTDAVDDADSDPANELQTLSYTDGSLSISGGNSTDRIFKAYNSGTVGSTAFDWNTILTPGVYKDFIRPGALNQPFGAHWLAQNIVSNSGHISQLAYPMIESQNAQTWIRRYTPETTTWGPWRTMSRWIETGTTLSTESNVSVTGQVAIGKSSPGADLDILSQAVSGRETIIAAKVSDAGNAQFGIGNATGTTGQFIPTFFAYNNTTRFPFFFRSLTNPANTGASEAMFNLQAGATNSDADPNNGVFSTVARNLLTVQNNTITRLTLSASGNLTATAFIGDGSGLTGITGDNLGNHTATTDLSMGGNDITFSANKTLINGASGTARFGDFGAATTIYTTHIDLSPQTSIPISGNNILFAREVLTDGVYTDNLYKTRLWVRSNKDSIVQTSIDANKQLLTVEDVPLTFIKTKATEQVKTSGSTTDFAASLPQGRYEVTYHFRYKTNTAGGGILWFVNTNADIDASEGGFTRTDQFATETAWTTGADAATPSTVTNTYVGITYTGVMEIDAATTVTVSTGPNGTGNLTLGANSYVKYVRIKKP